MDFGTLARPPLCPCLPIIWRRLVLSLADGVLGDEGIVRAWQIMAAQAGSTLVPTEGAREWIESLLVPGGGALSFASLWRFCGVCTRNHPFLRVLGSLPDSCFALH